MQENIAVVTGAGSGIGQASALALVEAGWTVVLAGRRKAALEETVSLAGTNAPVLAVPTDVARPESVASLFGEVRSRYGRVDLLFNNAGVSSRSTAFEDLTYEQWQTVVDINLTGAFLCAQAAYRLMASQSPQGGRIINNGSISAHVPRPNAVAYTTTKHGITGLTRQISLDGRRYGIACGQIDIGNAVTPLAANLADGALQADGSVRAEPMMDVGEVARTLVHMASLPLDANIQFVTVMATAMPFIGRG